MKKDLTELVFIIDRSGSMHGLEDDTIDGFNSMLEEQQEVEGEAVVTTIFFNNSCKVYHDRIDIRWVAPLTREDYRPEGSTALLDAIGLAIHNIRAVQRNTREEYRAEKVLFVIITDGQENASKHYTFDMIKERIEHQKKKYGWEFIFFGANMDAIAEAGKIGIDAGHAQNYSATPSGTQMAYSAMSAMSTSFRMNGNITDKEEEEAIDNLTEGRKEPSQNAEKNDEKIANVNEILRKVLKERDPDNLKEIDEAKKSDEESGEKGLSAEEVFSPGSMNKDLEAIREKWAPDAVITDAYQIRRYDWNVLGKKEESRSIHEETHLLKGELSAVTFQVGPYLVRKASRVYNVYEPGYSPEDETPASDEDVEMVREDMQNARGLGFFPSWSKRLRVTEEISARRLDGSGDAFTYICRAAQARGWQWSEGIGPIYTVKESESTPDESASLLVCLTFYGISQTLDTWYRLDVAGNITVFSVNTMPF